MTSKNLNIVNWDNVFKHSKTFQDGKPVKWVFVEDFFVNDFYEKLYETYPKKDDSWFTESNALFTPFSWNPLPQYAPA